MKLSSKVRAVLAALVLAPAAALFSLNPSGNGKGAEAGSIHCGKCHQKEYGRWRNSGGGASCESCHGPGRAHVLAPSPANILRTSDTSFSHGPAAPLKPGVRDTIRLELFVMSYCPYGTAALNNLLPLVRKWKGRVALDIHYIAHARGQGDREPGDEKGALPLEGGAKCESDAGAEEGTERFVSLHGLPEVLEDVRQVVIAKEHPDRLYDYLLIRNRELERDWKEAAAKTGFSGTEIRNIQAMAGSAYGDSLFSADIAVAEKRRVSGSPTLFINGAEFGGEISSYAVERPLCREAAQDTLCLGFPECAFDADCYREGKSGTCVDPMEQTARCVFRDAVLFEVTVVNDEACPLCHTGNIVRETRRRFPGARFLFTDIDSDAGRALIRRYGLKTYPSFLFGAGVEKSEKFAPIRHTFRKVKDRWVLRDYVVRSYHLLGRPEIPRHVDLFGGPAHPPAVEMVRDFESLADDTALSFSYAIHPWEEKTGGPEGKRQLCADSLYPGKPAYRYRLCRGFDVQKRFEEHLPEPAGEWISCAQQLGLDTTRLAACASGPMGRQLLERSQALARAAGVDGPDPVILLNNVFRISGYNPAIRKILIQELKNSPP